MKRTYKGLIALIAITIGLIAALTTRHESDLPVVAIANYGPHHSLDAAIRGFKKELEAEGFIDGKTVHYEMADVSFNTSMIPQMIGNLKAKQPEVMMLMGTPIAQFAKGSIKDIPLVYNVITDPVVSGLIVDAAHSTGNMVGSSDQQDMRAVLQFVKKLLPHAKRVGLLYATAENNDQALLQMMQKAAKQEAMELVAIPVDQARDVQLRMQGFKDKVDVIYVGTSGAIQPTLPVISAEATKMGIPIVNVDQEAVESGLVLASYGVDYEHVGANAGRLAAEILRGKAIQNMKPAFPVSDDHKGFVNRKKAEFFGVVIPQDDPSITIVE